MSDYIKEIEAENKCQTEQTSSRCSTPKALHLNLAFAMRLKRLLEAKNCFKLICGAGNQNLNEIEKLVALYSKAGCKFFDLAADPDVLIAAQRGLDFSIPKDEQKDYHFCISIGTKEDAHVQKAKINFMNCRQCAKCYKICPQGAINPYYQVSSKKCIGCLKCKEVCEHNAIETYSPKVHFDLSAFKSFNISCIELHASDANEEEADNIWQYLNNNFNGLLSLCIGCSSLSVEQVLKRTQKLITQREPYTTIIQADGHPMSGTEDDYKTTIPAVATAHSIQSANLAAYLMISGGTNSKTAQAAKSCNVDYNGISVGSYARKIVKEHIEREDFLQNKTVFDEALKIASSLVKSII